MGQLLSWGGSPNQCGQPDAEGQESRSRSPSPMECAFTFSLAGFEPGDVAEIEGPVMEPGRIQVATMRRVRARKPEAASEHRPASEDADNREPVRNMYVLTYRVDGHESELMQSTIDAL